MSYKTTQAMTKIRGLLVKAAKEGMDYQALYDATEGVATEHFDEALGELVANGEVSEKDGHYTLIKLIVDATAVSAAARKTAARELAAGVPPETSRTQHNAARKLAIVEFLGNAIGALPRREILEGLADPQLSAPTLKRLIIELEEDGRVVRVGSQNDPKFTVTARKAECELHLAQLQERDARPTRTLAKGRKQLVIAAGQAAAQDALTSDAVAKGIATVSLQQPAGVTSMSKTTTALTGDIFTAIKAASDPLKLSEIVAKCKPASAYKVKAALAELIDGKSVVPIGKGRGCRYGIGGVDRPAAPASAPRRGGTSQVGKELSEAADRAQQAFESFIFSCLSKEQQRQMTALRENRDNARRLAQEWQ